MTSYVPIIKNGAGGGILYVSLAPRTANGQWQSNPTLAAGDVKISLDGGAFANLNTLPAVTPAAGKAVKITLSQAETNADNITIVFSDAAGDEWCDLTINLQTVAKQFDDLATAAALTTVEGKIDTVDGVADAIKAKTDNLPSDPADASVIAGRFDTLDTAVGVVDGVVDAIKLKTDGLPSDPADASVIAGRLDTIDAAIATVDSNVDAILVDTGTDIPALLATIGGYLDTEIGAIKAKTDNLPSDPADASDTAAGFVAVGASLTTIAGYLDTEIAAIKAKTDNLPASPAATGDIPSAATIADAVWDEVVAGARTARQLVRGFFAILIGKVSGFETNTPAFRNEADDKTVVAMTGPGNGDRETVTLDLDE